MPTRAPSIRGCCGRRLPSSEMCACQAARRAKQFEARPSAAARGYDAEFQRLASAFLAEPGNERCACGAPATLVRHIISIRKRPDLRMVRSNWQPGCRSCNAKDAWRDRTGGGSKVSENP